MGRVDTQDQLGSRTVPVVAPVPQEAKAHLGTLPSGSPYVLEVPETWNGVLLVGAHPVPVAAGEPPWSPGDPLIDELVGHGFAVAGSASTIFWPLEQVFSDTPDLLEVAAGVLGHPRHTISYGLSIGGIISAGLVKRFPRFFSGALPMCGNLAGAVANHNRELDIGFVVKTLLAPRSDLKVTHIRDGGANLAMAKTVLHDAQASPSGRARLALAAAVGNIPGWYDAGSAKPDADDFAARQRNQFAWFDEPGFLVYFLARKQVEMQAGGNPSWNTDVDYAELVAGSINRDEVEALYVSAGLDLSEDLDRLASEPRVRADAAAAGYLERHIVFDGDLGGAPVLTVHTTGDGLVMPDHESAFAEVVRDAGQQGLLRQLYVNRGGHCTFSFAEILTALDVLLERIDSGAWPVLTPAAMNERAGRFGEGSNMLATGEAVKAEFLDFQPPRFSRRYDARDIAERRTSET